MKPVIAVSDIHGQILVFPALRKLRKRYPSALVVFCGDYQDSFHMHTGLRIIDTIYRMQQQGPSNIFVLKGNHDAALVESMLGINSYWLDAEGQDTLLEILAEDSLEASDIDTAFEMVKQRYMALFHYIDQLPLHVQLGKLVFVHAGFDLSLPDPINQTSEQDQYWLRESYWYGNNGKKRPVWRRNSLPFSIVSGHTPTSLMTGTYSDGIAAESTRRNRVASPHGILTVQYEDEFPRYFIDAGCHSGPASRIPNLGVFDAETGQLIEAVESTDAEDV